MSGVERTMDQREVLEYVLSTARSLRQLAKSSGLEFTAMLLEMVRKDADDRLARLADGGTGRTSVRRDPAQGFPAGSKSSS